MLQGRFGLVAGVVALLLGLGCIYYFVIAGDGQREISQASNSRLYIDEAGNTFQRRLEVGQEFAATSPAGKKAFPAELCYWTREGKTKPTPTPVFLVQHIKPGLPTFCPDCGRLVVLMNPAPTEGSTAPPTQAEYEARSK